MTNWQKDNIAKNVRQVDKKSNKTPNRKWREDKNKSQKRKCKMLINSKRFKPISNQRKMQIKTRCYFSSIKLAQAFLLILNILMRMW